MTTDSTVLAFQHPDQLDDPLTSVLRDGARRLLAQAIEAEAEAFLAAMKDERLADGRARVVRHGHGPERTIQTGIGPVPVRRAKLRDRSEVDGERITFSSAILPKWARRTKSLEALLPVLYLRGISTGDFQEALSALLGSEAPNLSPSVIGRLKEEWTAEYERWQRRDLCAKQYVYIWADGVYLQARMEDTAACMLVVIGATPQGRKELVGFQVGVRESTQSWRELLVDLKARGLAVAPQVAVGDGAGSAIDGDLTRQALLGAQGGEVPSRCSQDEGFLREVPMRRTGRRRKLPSRPGPARLPNGCTARLLRQALGPSSIRRPPSGRRSPLGAWPSSWRNLAPMMIIEGVSRAQTMTGPSRPAAGIRGDPDSPADLNCPSILL